MDLHCRACAGVGAIDSGGTLPCYLSCDACLGTGYAFAADAARAIESESDRIGLEAAHAGVVEQDAAAEAYVRLAETAKLVALAYEEAARRVG